MDGLHLREGALMLDNQLITLIIQILNTGFANLGVPAMTGVLVKQANQPTQQGANSAPTVYLTKIGDRRIGSMKRSSVWVPATSLNITTESGTEITTESGNPIGTDAGSMVNTQLQQYETSFQLSVLATQDPSDLTALTASDILNYAAFVMQADDCISALESNGIGILRINQVRNPYFSDDRQRFEAVPSFDFTLTHKQIIVKNAPIISTEEFIILPV